MQSKKEYQKPVIITYAEEDIIEIVGPAQTIVSQADF